MSLDRREWVSIADGVWSKRRPRMRTGGLGWLRCECVVTGGPGREQEAGRRQAMGI